MKRFLFTLCTVTILLFTVACEKDVIEPDSSSESMRSRPPCYEVAISNAIQNNSQFDECLEALKPLAIESVEKGCFNEFKMFIIEIYIELNGTISNQNIQLVHSFYDF